jgi:hypothetical protein
MGPPPAKKSKNKKNNTSTSSHQASAGTTDSSCHRNSQYVDLTLSSSEDDAQKLKAKGRPSVAPGPEELPEEEFSTEEDLYDATPPRNVAEPKRKVAPPDPVQKSKKTLKWKERDRADSPRHGNDRPAFFTFKAPDDALKLKTKRRFSLAKISQESSREESFTRGENAPGSEELFGEESKNEVEDLYGATPPRNVAQSKRKAEPPKPVQKIKEAAKAKEQAVELSGEESPTEEDLYDATPPRDVVEPKKKVMPPTPVQKIKRTAKGKERAVEESEGDEIDSGHLSPEDIPKLLFLNYSTTTPRLPRTSTGFTAQMLSQVANRRSSKYITTFATRVSAIETIENSPGVGGPKWHIYEISGEKLGNSSSRIFHYAEKRSTRSVDGKLKPHYEKGNAFCISGAIPKEAVMGCSPVSEAFWWENDLSEEALKAVRAGIRAKALEVVGGGLVKLQNTADDEHEVKKILAHRPPAAKQGGPHVEYLVQWMGHWPNNQEQSWTATADVVDSKLKEKYWKKQRGLRKRIELANKYESSQVEAKEAQRSESELEEDQAIEDD